jgi:hypothetical protein
MSPVRVRSRELLLAVLVALPAACSNAGTASPTPTVPSPTPDLVAQHYVALVHDFWIGELAADVATGRSNLAARVCLGMDPPGTPADVQLVDPAMCKARAVAILANHQKFSSDLDSTPPPPKFAADDRVFRAQLPITIADLKALISAADSGSKNAVLTAANKYNDAMYPSVTDALNDVDPSVRHP